MHKPNSIFEAAANILFSEAVEISDEDLGGSSSNA